MNNAIDKTHIKRVVIKAIYNALSTKSKNKFLTVASGANITQTVNQVRKQIMQMGNSQQEDCMSPKALAAILQSDCLDDTGDDQQNVSIPEIESIIETIGKAYELLQQAEQELAQFNVNKYVDAKTNYDE